MTFTRVIMHQKHLAQSGRSTRSAVDIFNTLCVFAKELIGEQEIKLECMNKLLITTKTIAYLLFSVSITGNLCKQNGLTSGNY